VHGRLALILIAAGWAMPVAGQPSGVCVEDRVRLERAAMAGFLLEFKTLLPEWEIGPCGPGRLRIALRFDPPARFSRALGLTWHAGERVLPAVEVYLNPILRALGEARTPGIVGRALARVAAHEVVHYGMQRLDHDSTGLLRPAFDPVILRGEDPVPFLLSKSERGASRLAPQ
jgi:hypothetical protein